MIVEPKVKGFLCITAHPEGCAENVREQIAYVKGKGEIKGGCKSALIIGSSTGYGLASRITAAFGCGAATVGVFFERPGDAARSRPRARAGTTPPNLQNRPKPQVSTAQTSTATLSATR